VKNPGFDGSPSSTAIWAPDGNKLVGCQSILSGTITSHFPVVATVLEWPFSSAGSHAALEFHPASVKMSIAAVKMNLVILFIDMLATGPPAAMMTDA
jgi:hypothetical protein